MNMVIILEKMERESGIESKGGFNMKKKSLLLVMLMILVLFSVTGCGSNSSSKRDWQKDAYEQGYYKGADGKWYHK